MTLDQLLEPDVQTAEQTPACAACPHPLAGHDAIALRFCRATVTSDLDRGCVCRSG
jgi:hypothetical protein